ncbi:esterase [Rhodococcus rhodnii]|uniref:Esterase n=2 Tax=Rhodococcus rhodnii TaxID=38312 RepID=R7WM28_9NOCA|nr:alpha/beta hydrolase-fold protein [Rhodococcus rhodnii]EOM76315.1 esterase [Rhodococcus rhodnii LMG 5362]TXG89990.1 esterase [Rhodococcus rhodnii]
MRWLTEVDLLDGGVPWVLAAVAVASAVWLLAGRARWFRWRALPITLLVAVAVTAAVWVLVEKVLRPFPDPIEPIVYVWGGSAIGACLLIVPRALVRGRVRSWLAALLAALAVVAFAGNQINRVFYAYPTIGSLFGVDPFARGSITDATSPASQTIADTPLDAHWSPPPNLRDGGLVVQTPIPGVTSGFGARPAQIYFPPAYFADPRPILPVLVMLAGQPGSPEDWLTGGELPTTMDAFAAAHGGLAPIVVVADATGTQFGNPLCVDSPLGNVATYLATDVPAWVDANLQASHDRRQWAIGGLSYGGTCSLQMTTNHPDVYPTFLDLSGQLEPTLGDRQRTLDAAFGGDAAAFAAVNPQDLLAHRTYPDSAGMFVVGADDATYAPGLQTLYQAARGAGMDVQFVTTPGGHSFEVWAAGLRDALPWLATRLGITS